MNDRFTEREAERILSGHPPETEEMAVVAELLAAMRTAYVETPTDDGVDGVVAPYAQAARAARLQHDFPEPAPTVSSPPRIRRARRRLATAASAAVLFAGLTGVALAANGSVPGDTWYGIDRAAEKIGIGAGGAQERIAEAQALFADGRVSEAVAHAAEAATEAADGGNEAAADALLQTASRLRATEQGGEQAVEVRNRVAAMLEFIAGADRSGPGFGQGVAALARGISTEDDAVEDPESAVEGAAAVPGSAREKAADTAKDARNQAADDAAEDAREKKKDAPEDAATKPADDAKKDKAGGPPSGVPGGPRGGGPPGS